MQRTLNIVTGLRHSALLATTFACAACSSPADLCDEDRLGCDDSAASFEQLNCTLPDPLSVVPGMGSERFVELLEGGRLDVEFGLQGGQHTFLGFRTSGVDTAQSPLLRATFEIYERNYPDDGGSDQIPDGLCSTPPFAWPVEADVDLAGECWLLNTSRTAVLGARSNLRTNDEGEVQEYGLLFLLDYYRSIDRRVAVTVEDQCGRKAAGWVDLEG